MAILSDNDIEHLLLGLGAMLAGVPYSPISPAYSTVSQDHGKLRHIFNVLTPGLVFASDAKGYGRAIASVVPAATEVVLTTGTLDSRATTPFAELLATTPTAAVDAAIERVGPDTIVKFLFTSGSTKLPKAVINTQHMICANQQQILQCFPDLGQRPPVLVDWLPWTTHTFGGNHNVGLTIYNGGTLHIDEGKPTPALIGKTLANLREIAPTVYFNVPKGFEEIANAMEADAGLRERFFSRVSMFFFAGAGLSQPVWDKLDRLAEQTVGERIRMLTGLGMTETAPFAVCANGPEVKSGYIGLPAPGMELKLVPEGDKTEVRYRGPNVTPGYWRAPEQTHESFDDEGFYRSGDAVKPIDPANPGTGFAFDGRTAEDFKLSTGTFVSVGPLRARVIAAGDPCVQDAVITGINRDEIGVLIFPRLDACRAFAQLPHDASAEQALHAPQVKAFFQRVVDELWSTGTGSATRVARLSVLVEPPSIDRGEITDKGSINQRAVLTHPRRGRRAALPGRGGRVPAAPLKKASHGYPRTGRHRHRRCIGARRADGARTRTARCEGRGARPQRRRRAGARRGNRRHRRRLRHLRHRERAGRARCGACRARRRAAADERGRHRQRQAHRRQGRLARAAGGLRARSCA